MTFLQRMDRKQHALKMAFDFERYLRSCEPDDLELFKSRPGIDSLWDCNDDTPVSKSLFISKDAVRKSLFPSKRDDEKRPIGVSGFMDSKKGLDMIESKFRSHHTPDQQQSGRSKPGLFKQTSLPASFSSYGKAKAKSETGRRRRNSVRFADEMGENLTTFLMIPSRFDDSEHDKDACAACDKSAKHDHSTSICNKNVFADLRATSGATPTNIGHTPADGQCQDQVPWFQLCFDQPAARFDEFRRRLFLQFVCLENVKVDVKSQTNGTSNGVVNHGTVLCTIKVRNIHPTKRVFARCTDNNWKSYADISAVYLNDGSTGHKENDTFAFALRNPFGHHCTGSRDKKPEADVYCRKTAAVEFAVCYQVLGSEYWDNNNGKNYRIVWM